MAKLPELDYAAEADKICARLVEITSKELRRKGLVVAMSGGIDSSVCSALAVRALGANRVFGIFLPERDSSGESSRLGRLLAEHLKIKYALQDISPALAALGCYSSQEEVLRRVLPGYGADWKFKLVISEAMGGKIGVTRIVARDPAGKSHEQRLSAADYLQIVAATNFKQRVRKNLEYFHADRLNYAVVGTPNRLEYDQGFFVKNGDGAADVKPIAHLYKSHVYGMARYLGLPADIVGTTPTTDTFSLSQGQDEFYFGLPYPQMDLALWHLNNGRSAAELAKELGCTPEQAEQRYESIRAKRRTTAPLHMRPVLVEDVSEIHHG